MRNPASTYRRLCVFTLVACACASNPSTAEPPSPGAVVPASYQRDIRNDSPQTIRFTRRAPQIGDQLEQTMAFDLQLHQIMRQNDHVIEQAEMATHRHQRRLVTTTDVAGGAAVAALVRYPEATTQVITAQTASELKTLTAPVAPQPVQNKAYRCRRTNAELEITDEKGDMPPLDEYKIVAQNMDTFGRKNPLADFLTGRTITVGEKVTVPNEIAERLLGLGDELGQVSRFDLVLGEVKTVDGAECAVFHASIDAASTNASQMRMEVEGPLVVQASTCRAIDAAFAGPLGMSETRGSVSEKYQMSATGRISMRIATTYRDVAP
jgi:hypothetical protein